MIRDQENNRLLTLGFSNKKFMETDKVTRQTTIGIWETFRGPLHSYILKRVCEPAQADDLLQEVFLKIHKRLHTLRDEEKLPAWLYSIARNVIIDHYRDRRTSASLAEEPIFDDRQDEVDASTELAVRMRYFVRACLPEMYGRALMLADLEGKTQQEVATALGLSLSGAKTRVQRARKMLREAFLECCHFEFDSRKRVIHCSPKVNSTCTGRD